MRRSKEGALCVSRWWVEASKEEYRLTPNKVGLVADSIMFSFTMRVPFKNNVETSF